MVNSDHVTWILASDWSARSGVSHDNPDRHAQTRGGYSVSNDQELVAEQKVAEKCSIQLILLLLLFNQ